MVVLLAVPPACLPSPSPSPPPLPLLLRHLPRLRCCCCCCRSPPPLLRPRPQQSLSPRNYEKEVLVRPSPHPPLAAAEALPLPTPLVLPPLLHPRRLHVYGKVERGCRQAGSTRGLGHGPTRPRKGRCCCCRRRYCCCCLTHLQCQRHSHQEHPRLLGREHRPPLDHRQRSRVRRYHCFL